MVNMIVIPGGTNVRSGFRSCTTVVTELKLLEIRLCLKPLPVTIQNEFS